ncbi:SLAIN motif-containing protein-like [Gadus macrocephalus]|uniref:SLAIN motif-containing protein-like n=1 Tax=Gadus macrocephalus TaxID=80720 RepID=UPI0028CB1FDE|nr:SLAIN motif-containing protein-like [Gadus macrocephalus]
MSVLAPTLWADHSRCDLEFEDWSQIFENQTEGPTMTDWNQSLCGRPSEPGARHSFLLPPSEDEEEDDEDEDEEDEDEDFTAGARSLPIPYRLVWMDEGSDGATCDQDPGSPPWGTARGSVAEQPGPLDALEVLEEEQEGRDDTRWLYESPQQQSDQDEVGDPSVAALSWSRRVLDHPSPDMEAACRVLNNILDNKFRAVHISSTRGRPSSTVYDWQTSSQTSTQAHHRGDWDSSDYRLEDFRSQAFKQKDYRSEESTPKDYRSQQPTDLQVLAREQEASLRGEHPGYALGDISHLDPLGNAWWPPAPPSWGPPAPPSWGPPPYSRPSANHRRPQLRKLQHRVTELKLLALLQSKEAAVTAGDGGPAPLLRTSLRSLQAVRKSRSLEGSDSGHAHSGHAHLEAQCLTPPPRARRQSDGSPVHQGSTASRRLSRSTRTPPLSPGGPHPHPSTHPSRPGRVSSSPHPHPTPTTHPHPSTPPSAHPHPSTHASGHGRAFSAPARLSVVDWRWNRSSVQR